MVGVADDHLGGAARCAARLDRTSCTVANLEEAHEARRFAAARKRFGGCAERREVRAGARAVLEEACFADPEVHDAALVHQIVGDRLDKTGVGLWMLVSRGRFRQLAGLVVDIVVALAWPVDAVSPMQTGVEPLGRVRRGPLGGQHVAHLVEVSARVFFGREVAALPAPVGPSACEAVEHLLGRRFTSFRGIAVFRNRAPQERRHAFFTNRLLGLRHTRLTEVFLRNHVGRHLAPRRGNLHIVKLEHNRPIRIADLGRCRCEFYGCVGVFACLRELAFDFHSMPLAKLRRLCRTYAPCFSRWSGPSNPRQTLPPPRRSRSSVQALGS